MQPNVITLPVDEGNNGTTTDHVYDRFEEHLDRTIYVTDAHLVNARDTLGLYRTHPKPSGNFRGTQKTSFKFTKDVVVTGVDGVAQLTAPLIIEVCVSAPVGTLSSDVLIARQRTLALLDNDSIMTPFMDRLMI